MTARFQRKGSGQKFVMLHRWMTNSKAWQSLNPAARAAYLEFGLIYDGTNNGYLALAVRQLGDRLGVGKDVAARALRDLQDRGFIECCEASSFNRKNRASKQWRLTEFQCDRTNNLPSKRFMSWPFEEKQQSRQRNRQSCQRDKTHQKEGKNTPTVAPVRLSGPKSTNSQSRQRDTYIYTMGGTS